MALRTLCIVTPVHWDTDAFLILHDRVIETLGTPWEGRLNFVVVDDSAGTDLSIARLESLPDVEVITPPFNLGHQRAIIFGLRRVVGTLEDDDVVVTMDADGEDLPEDLPRLLEPLGGEALSRHVIALALRTVRRETPAFKLAYKAFKLVFRTLTGEVIRTGNFAAYSAWLGKQMIGHPYFDMSYSATLISLQVPHAMVPCERGDRYAGRSSMNLGRLVMHGLGMLMPFTDRIALRALATFSFTIFAAVFATLVVVSIRLFTDLAIPGWATYTVLLLITLSFVALGNFVVLFALFSQTRAMSFADLHRAGERDSLRSVR
jgi:glycosyltransferase involved in cell wall biosynthesis